MKTLKRILSLLICLTLTIPILPALPAFAETYSGTCGDDLTWSLDDGILTISGTGDMTNYGYPYAPWYDYNTNITSIVIGNDVTSIGDYAFHYCSSLTNVKIGSSVMSIGSSAFYNCTALTNVTIPDNVISIGDNAFRYCPALTSVTIGAGMTSISYSAFGSCGKLNIVVDPDNLYYSSADGVLFNKNQTEIITYAKDEICPNYTIPEGVTSIGSNAFIYCSALTNITIPDSVTNIGYDAFWDCSSLTSIEIPDSVTALGGGAFFRCINLTSATIGSGVTSIDDQTFLYSGLTNITIGNNVTSIGESAFCGAALTSVTIPDSVTTIGNGAFSICSHLTSVTIGSGVTSIDHNAFADCTSLTSVTIPKSVTSIGSSAFSGCGSLNITVDSDNPYYSSLDGVLFNKNQTEIITYSKDEICPDYTIPDSVTTIGGAFSYCRALTSITIGNNVTSIESTAFYCCSALTSVTIGSSVTSIGKLAFYECYDLPSITIPNSVTNIDEEAFWFCTSLASITIPDSVTSIGDYAFDACSSLTDVYYSGSEDEWAAISLGWGNECLTDATIHYNSSPADDEIKVYLNGTPLSFDQPPIMINNRTMVPLRAIFEAMGYNVEWNNDTQTAQAVKNSDTITVQIGNNTISYVTNGQSGTYVCDVAPQIISDRTLVPARAIAESAGCTVEWDGSTQTVTITANTEN